ncbi:MAG TPA: hypothetical protein PLM75_00595 [bacterium]|nr:hypothetical protein [bacterium]HPP86344.1 hypothetical protein [bacterium]
MNFYIVLAAFSLVNIITIIYSFKQTQKFFNSTIDGFLHYPNSTKYLVIPHILICLISISIFAIYTFIYQNQSINLKIFLTAIFTILFLTLINYLTLLILYVYLKSKLKKEGYIALYETDNELGDSEYINKILSKEFNAMIRNYVGIIAVVYLFFFIFPTSLIDEKKISKESGNRQGRNIIDDAKFYGGSDWFVKLVHNRRKYIQRWGYAAYMKNFGEQMKDIEPEIILYEKKNEAIDYEKTRIEREKERILYSDFNRHFDKNYQILPDTH